MDPLNIVIEGLNLDTVVGARYDEALTLADLIADKAVQNLTKDNGYTDVYNTLRQRVTKIRDEEIRARIRVDIEQVFAEPLVPTNQWGERTGKEPVTLRSMITTQVEKFFTEKRSKDQYDRGPKFTDAQFIVAEMVKTQLTAEMVAAFADEKAAVIATIQAKAAELLAAAIKEGLRK